MSKKITSILQKLIRSEDLNHFESDLLVKKIFKKEIDDVCLSSILTLLFIKGESYEEIKPFVFYLKNVVFQNCLKTARSRAVSFEKSNGFW